MPVGAIIGAGASLLGGAISSKAAKDATAAQTDIGMQEMALARETRDLNRQDFSTFLQSGALGNQAYMYEMGLGNAPMIGGQPQQIETIPGTRATGGNGNALGMFGNTAGIAGAMGGNGGAGGGFGAMGAGQAATPASYRVGGQNFATMADAQAYANANPTGGQQFGGFKKTPGYDFQLSQGMDALQSTAAARGGLYSGAAMQAAQTYGQGLANQEYGTYLNRLAGIGQSGQAAAGMQADANTNYAQMGTNALSGIGNAQSAGAIAQGNAWNGALGNLVGSYNYMSGTQGQGNNNGSWNIWNGGNLMAGL